MSDTLQQKPDPGAPGRGSRPLLGRVRRFVRLPSAKRSMAVEAALALLLARLLTRLVPASCWLRFLDTAAGSGTDATVLAGDGQPLPRELGRAVEKVARHLPFRVRCLPQAMAVQWMLRRRGLRSTLVFGVRRGMAAKSALEFHAWLMVGGECVVGGDEVESFSAFPPFVAVGGGL